MQVLKLIVSWLLLASPLIGLFVFSLFFLNKDELSYFEVRLIILFILIIGVVIAFSTLRLYNAILNNTRTNIALKREFSSLLVELRKFVNVVDRESRNTQHFSSSINRLVDSLKDAFNKIVK